MKKKNVFSGCFLFLMEHDGRYGPELWISDQAEEGKPLRPKFKESPGA